MSDNVDPLASGSGGEARRGRLAALLDQAVGGSAGERASWSPRRHGLSTLLDRLRRVCAVAVDVTGADGAGVTVVAVAAGGWTGHRDQLAAIGVLTRRLEDLQLTAGEGPCVDAFRDGVPVLAGDLAGESSRWLGFVPDAVAAGAAAVFSLPLQVGAVRLGTLDLHRAVAGPLAGEQLADAVALASLATEAVLQLVDRSVLDETGHDAGSEDGVEPPQGWLPNVHADVHVASGMVSAQLRVDVGSALRRIRAYAFARSEPIDQVARRIIDRDLTFTDHDGPPDSPTDWSTAPEKEEGQP